VIEAIGGRTPPSPEIDTNRKIAFLGSPAAYGGGTLRVDRIETHFSWVFLTERYVFKLKKPLCEDGVDLSSLAARRRNAEEEIRLNRRLAPDVYLGVVPLTCDARGLALAGKGAVVDWLVEMIRLPDDRMLDRRIARSAFCTADIEALGARLANFFATARQAKIGPKAYLDHLHRECRLSREVFRRLGGPVLLRTSEDAARRIDAFLGRARPALAQRVEDGHLVEGHGDLRPEHICLGSPPRIIDCLEFRADLRCLDPVDELAFLAMECEKSGAPGIGKILFYRYCEHTGDRPPARLTILYRAIGAMIRARIAILHLQAPGVREPAKWPKRAAGYLAIARRAALRLIG
jgi:uncharacterized protein